ncbi:MAG: methyltransferase domain-containing protein [Polyangiaceae bacterium]
MDPVEPTLAPARRPWEVARADAALRILGERRRRIGRMLDFGGGSYTGQRLFGELGGSAYVGYDPKLSEAECAARSRGSLRFANSLPPAAAEFDLVLLCDTLEHAADDRALLRAARARVHASGRVLALVPAFDSLYSDYDRELSRLRRYDLPALCESFSLAGLPVTNSGHLFGSLLAPRVLRRVGEGVRAIVSRDARAQKLDADAPRSPLRTRLLSSALALENRALLSLNASGVKVPGLTAWALCDLREVP